MKTKGFYRVHAQIVQGDRKLSNLMAAAGLGLAGAGVREKIQIDYKPGEDVDEVRVEKMMENMIQYSEREQTSFKILSYKINKIEFIPI